MQAERQSQQGHHNALFHHQAHDVARSLRDAEVQTAKEPDAGDEQRDRRRTSNPISEHPGWTPGRSFKALRLVSQVQRLEEQRIQNDEAGRSNMFLFLALQLLVWTDQTNAFDTLRVEGRNALLESRYADAERLLKAAIAEAGKGSAVAPSLRAVVLNDLAETYRPMGRLAEAETLYKESLSILRQQPESVRSLVMVLNNLGALFREEQQYSKSILWYEEAMRVAKKSLPANDALFGTILHGFAAFSAWKGDLREAQNYLERSLRIRELALGSTHHEVVQALNGLGVVQMQRKQYSKAEDSFRRGLALMEQLYGPKHSDVATLLNNLGTVLHAEKKYTEAEQALQQSLKIYRTNLTGEDPRIADVASNLAQLFIDQQRFAESEPLLKEAIGIRSSQNHRVSERDALAYERYAVVLRGNGRTADADAADARARSIRSELRYTFKP